MAAVVGDKMMEVEVVLVGVLYGESVQTLGEEGGDALNGNPLAACCRVGLRWAPRTCRSSSRNGFLQSH